MNVTLDSIVRGHLVNTGRNTLHGYVKLLKYLIDFMRKFALKHAFMDRTVVLKLDQKKSVAFPEDFIMWSKVGWQQGDRIVAFQRDATINLHHSTEEDGVETPTVNEKYNIAKFPYNQRADLVFNNFINQDGETGFLEATGIGHNGLGYFRCNFEAREFQFSSDTPIDFEIYLEYKSNGFNATTKSTVPEVAAKLGEDYIYWQEAHYKLGAAAAETEARRITYLREYDDLIAITEPITPAAIEGIRARGFDINKLVY